MMREDDRKYVEEIRKQNDSKPAIAWSVDIHELLAIIDRMRVATPGDVERVTRAVRGHVEYAKQARAALLAMGFEVAE